MSSVIFLARFLGTEHGERSVDLAAAAFDFAAVFTFGDGLATAFAFPLADGFAATACDFVRAMIPRLWSVCLSPALGPASQKKKLIWCTNCTTTSASQLICLQKKNEH